MATTISSERANSPKLTANIADHGTIYGGRGLIFDGVTDYLLIADSPVFGFADGQSFSTSMWFKTTQATGEMYLYDCRTGGGATEGFASVIQGNGTNYLAYYADGSSAATVTNTTDYHDGNWHHIVITWDGTNTIKAYIDGSLTGTGTQALGEIDGGDMYIGRYNDSAVSHFNGSMADFKIFNTALTEAQVQELYLKPEQSAPSAVQDNLVAWYPMCEGNPDSPQSIVYDHSEKGKLGSNLVDTIKFQLEAKMTSN